MVLACTMRMRPCGLPDAFILAFPRCCPNYPAPIFCLFLQVWQHLQPCHQTSAAKDLQCCWGSSQQLSSCTITGATAAASGTVLNNMKGSWLLGVLCALLHGGCLQVPVVRCGAAAAARRDSATVYARPLPNLVRFVVSTAAAERRE
jgi:hypothetical protein